MPPRPPTEHDETTLYDMPPVPDGVHPGFVYMAQVQAHATRAVILDNRREHAKLRESISRDDRQRGSGSWGWLGAAFRGLDPSVRAAIMMSIVLAGGQLVGAVYERITGHAPPQPSQPTFPSTVATPTATASTPQEP